MNTSNITKRSRDQFIVGNCALAQPLISQSAICNSWRAHPSEKYYRCSETSFDETGKNGNSDTIYQDGEDYRAKSLNVAAK